MKKCAICKQDITEKDGGPITTGDTNKPTYLWVCNRCFKDMVCP